MICLENVAELGSYISDWPMNVKRNRLFCKAKYDVVEKESRACTAFTAICDIKFQSHS